jgi:hypothetical protein
MEAETLLELLFVATGAKTDEERARIAWRFSDAMWRQATIGGGGVPLGTARAFNNLCQDQDWPWVKDLWSTEEIDAYKAQFQAQFDVAEQKQ